MDERNFNGISYKDYHLGEQINLVLKEYNSIARKISESKNDIISNKNYNPFSFNYNNDNIITNKNNDTFFGRNNLIEDFKDTLEKSQIIKDDLLRKYRKSIRNKNYSSKTYSYLNEIPKKIYLTNNKKLGNSKINKNEIGFLPSLIEDENRNYSNGGINENIPNGKDINGELYINDNHKNLNELDIQNFLNENMNLDYNEKNKKKLELSRDAIIKSYQKIKKENRILEVEINNYKNLSSQYLNFGSNFNIKNNNYYESSINNYKQTFQQNIQNNCRIIDLIINIQKKIHLFLIK